MSHSLRNTSALVSIVVGMLVLFGTVTAGGIVAETGSTPVSSTDGAQTAVHDPSGTNNVSEEAYVEPAPEPGDPYFQSAAEDGSWVSYKNPRDEYRSPYLGDGSAKICTTLLNEDGDPVVGESVPNTTVTIPTGDAVEWHSSADPITVQFPLTDNYDRPLDADQFGTDPELPQGDGYMDSHCVEFHGLAEDATVEYGEARVDGEYADRIDVVGYVQQEHRAWDTSVDPIAAAESYEDAGGGWTYRPDGSHGQAVVVLQLDPPDERASDGENETDDRNGDGAGNETADESNETADGSPDTGDGSPNTGDESDDTSGATTPARDDEAASADPDEGSNGGAILEFGVLAAIGATAAAVFGRARI